MHNRYTSVFAIYMHCFTAILKRCFLSCFVTVFSHMICLCWVVVYCTSYAEHKKKHVTLLKLYTRLVDSKEIYRCCLLKLGEHMI